MIKRMDPLQALHNAHWDDADRFCELDPQLRRLTAQPLVHKPALLVRLPTSEPGIYSVGGARQVGKTTLVKQWMQRLLERGEAPARVAYLTGELVDDHHVLVREVRALFAAMPVGRRFLALDEVTYIRDWDRGLKFLADAGLLDEAVLLLTGSDLALMRDARARFPGRRGAAAQVDFHLRTLSFREAVELKRGADWTRSALEGDEASVDALTGELTDYLRHGGYLTAINDLARSGRIEPATLRTYADWLRGDMAKRGKQEHFLREVLNAILERLGSQVSWNALSRALSIDHPATVKDYVELLARMDAVFVQPALREDRLAAAPKKARKVMFADPFVGHAADAWLRPTTDPYAERIVPRSRDAAAPWVEAVVATHFARHYPTYYIKAKGEVDVAYVDAGRFHPVEVKWGRQIRPKDLAQVARYPNGRIWARVRTPRTLNGVPVEPLPLALCRLG